MTLEQLVALPAAGISVVFFIGCVEKQPEQAALEDRNESIPAFAVFAPDADTTDAKTLVDILAGDDKQFSVVKVDTIQEAIASKANVLALQMNRFHQTKVSNDVIEALKSRKVIGIGYGAAQLFEKLGLEINGGACAHNPNDYTPRINIERNTIIGESVLGEPIVAFELPSDAAHLDVNFAMYIPRKSHLRSVVDVIARWAGDENYAPIVRQGNYVMLGLAAPPTTWTPKYRKIFHNLAIALHARKPEPFSTAKWEITKPGTYKFELAKGRNTEELTNKTFYFQFAEATTFSAYLEHEGSEEVMLLFMDEKSREHLIRKDAYQGEPLEISIDITSEDIQGIGDSYWRLKVTNFDSAHTANCSLVIEY